MVASSLYAKCKKEIFNIVKLIITMQLIVPDSVRQISYAIGFSF